MNLRVRDIIIYQGQDLMVEGVLSYRMGDRVYPLARAVDGGEAIFIEPLLDDMDDRLLFLREIDDLVTATPPPQTLLYRGESYLPRRSGKADVTVEGRVPGRDGGQCELWHYRAAGDLFIQIEKWSDRVVTLAGESVHKAMVDILPGSDVET